MEPFYRLELKGDCAAALVIGLFVWLLRAV